MKALLRTLFVTSNLLAFAPSFAAAGNSSGGGGNAVACFKDPQTLSEVKSEIQSHNGWIPSKYISADYVQKVELLDLYEARGMGGNWDHLPENEFIAVKQNETVDELYERILKRLENVAPKAVRDITRGKESLSEFRYAMNGLSRIDDISNYEIIGDDKCMRVTIMAQVRAQDGTYLSLDARFFQLPESIFSKLDRAAAKLHEYIYYFPLGQGVSNSDVTRKLVGILLLKEIGFVKLRKALIAWANQFYFRQDKDMNIDLTFVPGLKGDLLQEFSKVEESIAVNYSQVKFGSEKFHTNFHQQFSIDCEAKLPELRKKMGEWYESVGQNIILSYQLLPLEIRETLNEHMRSAFPAIKGSHLGRSAELTFGRLGRTYKCEIEPHPSLSLVDFKIK